MNPRSRYFNVIHNERPMADFIPYSSHVSPTTLITKEGHYLRLWKVAGIPHETADSNPIQVSMDQLNTLWRAIGTAKTALWTHNVRRKISDRLVAEFDNEFCRQLDQKYYGSFTGYRMMANELYITLLYRPDTGLKALRGKRSVEDIQEAQRHALQHLDEIAFQIESSLSKYGIEPLTTYSDAKGVVYSKALVFLHFLVSGEWQQKVRVPQCALNEYLATSWLLFGTEALELRTIDKTRYAQALDFKDYVAHTHPGLLNALMYEDYEYVLTQSFSFLSKQEAIKTLGKQQKQLMNTDDGSATQIEQMTEAIDELIQGTFCLGEYHFSLMVWGDSLEDVRKHIGSAKAILQNLGFLAALVTTAIDAAFYAQLPGNWRYRPRTAYLTSKNFAGLSSFHNFSTGKREGNPWGQAVTLLKTPSGQPVYFNFHLAHELGVNNFDQKLLGNTRIIGQSGAGKTVLMGFLACQAHKFKKGAPHGFTDVFFDKDRGAEIVIRAMGGKYLAIKNGEPTGFNPFQLEATENNIVFLEKLIRVLVTEQGPVLTVSDQARISHAVRTVMRMPRQLRRLSTLPQNMTEGTSKEERENSLVKRLAKWCAGGSLAWVLDNPVDVLDFSTHRTYGFDGTDFLDNAEVRTPLALYLLHRMEQIIDGRRFIYYMDEFWRWLEDDIFSDFAKNKQKTIRKKNGLGVFATQSPSDVLGSEIARSIIEQCATEIYLPNPKADQQEYVEGFKVSEAEYQLIKNLPEDSHQFLVKQGHTSALARLDLHGFDDELSVLSSTTDNTMLVHEIIAEVGDDPNLWLPLFHKRRKARRENSQKHVSEASA